MMPPEAPANTTGNTPPAASLCLKVMRKRPEYLAAAHARRQGTSTMLVQGRERNDGEASVHVGFTCSKKVGNAVTRNRAKRRLRALAQEVLVKQGRPGWDYVLIGKPGATAVAPFDQLRHDLTFALRRIHAHK